jgi:hypothetical protein
MSRVTSRRVATVLLAAFVALAAWALCRAGGVAFHVSTGSGRVRAADVFFVATAAALLGWLLVRWLERHVQRPRLWWAWVASACLGASIVGPSRLAGGIDGVALMGLHVVTAAVIILGYAPTLPVRRRVPRSADGAASSARIH